MEDMHVVAAILTFALLPVSTGARRKRGYGGPAERMEGLPQFPGGVNS